MTNNRQRREAAKRKLARQVDRRSQQAAAQRQRLVVIGVIAAVLVVVGGIWLATSGGSGDGDVAADAAQGEAYGDGAADGDAADDAADGTDNAADTADESTADPGACAYPATAQPAAKTVEPPADTTPPTEGSTEATLHLSAGDVTVTLDRTRTPCTTNSFLSLAEQGYYDDVVCHRLTTSPTLSVLQCGDPSGTGAGGPGYSFADELDGTETYGAGTLAMANAGADTNGSQFFLVYADSRLSPDYTVFGHITAGLDVVEAIGAKGTDSGRTDGAPAEPVAIESVTVA